MTERAAAAAKRLLPMFDAGEPIVCTIAPEEKADRIAIIERLRVVASTVERTDVGLLLTFPRSETVRADLDRFVVDEKRCCRFWGFAVVDGGEDLALRWDGPPDAGLLLDLIERVLRLEAPVEAIEGLL